MELSSVFVNHEAKKKEEMLITINNRYREYLEGLRNGIITDFRMPNLFGECKPVNEYYNFLANAGLLNQFLLGQFKF